MHRSSLARFSLGIVSTLLLASAAPAALWSIEADCKRGDWTVDVAVGGFGLVDASCEDGGKTRLSVETGEAEPAAGSIAALSSRGTACEGPATDDAKLVLKCGSETEDATGFETEEELEVEVEREADDDAPEVDDD